MALTKTVLHPTKSKSILQWYNALTPNVNVQSLSQFKDGYLFSNIIETVYSQAEIEYPVPKFLLSDSLICEEGSLEGDKIPWDKAKDGEEPEVSASSSTQQTEAMETSEDQSEVSFTKDNDKEMGVQKKYEFIKKFIDTFFQMDSSNIISYSECMTGQDLELAKVAVLLLSAMVQNFLSSGNEILQTITHLQEPFQEDIKECLSLLLDRNDKDPLTQIKLHRILGKATKHKATPRRKISNRGNSDDTPSTKRRPRPSTIANEEVRDSPLKGLLQSPNNSQHIAAMKIFKKETEISKLRKELHLEEMKNVDLLLEKKQLNDDLLKKKEELEFMKSDFRKYKEMTEEREAHHSVERANLSEEINRLNSLISEQKEEIKSLQTEHTDFVTTITELENKLVQKNVSEESADKAIIENMNNKIQELETENDSKGNVMQEYIEKIKYLERDIVEYKQMYEEQLNRRDTPKESPPIRETIGDIHYADAQDAVKKLQEKEKELQKLKNTNRSISFQLKEKTDNIQAVLDKLSNLQDKHEKLLQKSRTCPTCRTMLESEESDASRDSQPTSSSQFGKLWDISPKSNAPTTRSKSTGSFTTSTPVNYLTVQRLQADLRSISKMFIKWKLADKDEVESMTRMDADTRSLETVEDCVKGFEKILRILKKAMPSVSETVAAEAKAVKESVEPDSSEQQLLEKTKKKFSIMAASLKTDLLKKDKELSAAKEEIKKLQLEKESMEKTTVELDNNLKKWKLKYDGLYKGVQKLKHDRSEVTKKFVDLQKEIDALQQKPDSCSNCDVLRKKLTNAREDQRGSEKEIDDLKVNIKDLQYKIKSLERCIKDLIQEKEKLKDKIEHNNAFLFGSSAARNALINKYYQQSVAEKKKTSIPDLDDLDSEDSQPIVNVNTFFLCPERKKQAEIREYCPETSTSSHFANRSIKSAYLQTEDEEDFLNHSSLSQIQGGYFEMETANSEQRLWELQRRNTLCPPHLKSSYPLEIKDMTPSERKYSMLPSQFPSTSGQSEALKKRKISGIDASHSHANTKKVRRMCVSPASLKPHTPLGLASALKKGKAFKTPSSIRRLMRMPPRKNKQQ